jgi:hypothetical protein
MDDRKTQAMKRGLRTAARVASVAGLVAAAAAQAEASTSEAPTTGNGTDTAALRAPDAERVTDPATLAEQIRLSGAKKNCGCSPCWGPPAPPPMDWVLA